VFYERFFVLTGYFLLGIALSWSKSPITPFWFLIYPLLTLVNYMIKKWRGESPSEIYDRWTSTNPIPSLIVLIIYWVSVLGVTIYIISTNQ